MTRVYVYDTTVAERMPFVEYEADAVPAQGDIFTYRNTRYTVKWVEWQVLPGNSPQRGEHLAQLACVNVAPN